MNVYVRGKVQMGLMPGDKVTWSSRVNFYDRPIVRTGIFDHYVDHGDFWAEEKARIRDVDGVVGVSLYVPVDRLERA